MAETITAMWKERSAEALARSAAEAMVFSSPVADYRGAEAIHLIGLVGRAIDHVETTNHWDDGAGDAMTTFIARVGEEPVDGVVRELRDAHGMLVRVVLFLRPLSVLDVAIERMKALRRQHPGPLP